MLQRRGLEREKQKTALEGLGPPNLLNISLCGLASSCLPSCPFCLHLGSHALAPSILTLCMYMQQTRKQTSRQAKKQIEGRHTKRHASKRCQTGANNHVKHMKGANKHVIKQNEVSQEDKCRFGLSVHSSIGLENGRHTNSCMNMQASVQRCKRRKESQTGGTKQARQAYQHRTEPRKVCIKCTNTTQVYLTSGYI